MDLHHNLFYSYRGPVSDEADRDSQLENNVTKALINTLKLGGEAVWRPFLAKLGVTDVKGAQFLLQRRNLPSEPAARKSNRVLLGISKKESHWSPGAGTEGRHGGVPDAWVYGDRFAILVESKVNDADFSPEQMERHYERLCSTEHRPPKVVLRTWREIHGFFHRLLPNLTDDSQLLVEQFIQFLEYSDMSGFTGFRREHLNYFVLHDDDEARRWIGEQVQDFAERVRSQLHKVDPFYKVYDRGNLKPTSSHCWVAFGPANPGYRKLTHQTISLGSNGLKVFVNTELKPAANRLKAVLKHSQSMEALRAALHVLHASEPFELVLEERILERPRVLKETLKMRLHSSLLADEAVGDVAWKAFVETVHRLPLPYMHIDRRVPPKELLELSEGDASAAVQHVVAILKTNHAIVKLLNG
jgi:hypothetical protein